jgi:hypothetical protein
MIKERENMVRRFVKWFKIRFVFSDAALFDTLAFFDRVDRDRLNDERLWTEVQYNVSIIKNELNRRGWEF